MIQRIQTIFLILASASFGSLFGVPFAISDVTAAGFLADKVYNIQDHPALLALAVIGVLVSLLAVFMYANRKRQRRLVFIIIILGILLPIASFLLFMGNSPDMYASAQVHDQIGLFIPAAALLFGGLANYFIAKDEKLVQSMDRLR